MLENAEENSFHCSSVSFGPLIILFKYIRIGLYFSLFFFSESCYTARQQTDHRKCEVRNENVEDEVRKSDL